MKLHLIINTKEKHLEIAIIFQYYIIINHAVNFQFFHSLYNEIPEEIKNVNGIEKLKNEIIKYCTVNSNIKT